MNPISRRDAIFLGLTGCYVSSVTTALGNQAKSPPISGRIVFSASAGKNPQVMCSLIGENNARISGQFNPTSGEFSFAQVPPGDALLLRIQFNGQSFEYPELDGKAKSRLEIRLFSFLDAPAIAAAEKKDVKTLMTAMGVGTPEQLRSALLRTVNAMGTFGIDYLADAKLREEYREFQGAKTPQQVLDTLGAAIETVVKASEEGATKLPANRLLEQVYAAVRALWQPLRP